MHSDFCSSHSTLGACAKVAVLLQAVAFAKKYVLEKGPIVLEMDTYRYHGHSMSDPGSTYRTRDEISSMRQLRDPIEHVRKLLLEKAGADPSELKKIEKVGFYHCWTRQHLLTEWGKQYGTRRVPVGILAHDYIHTHMSLAQENPRKSI